MTGRLPIRELPGRKGATEATGARTGNLIVNGVTHPARDRRAHAMENVGRTAAAIAGTHTWPEAKNGANSGATSAGEQ